MLGSYWIYSYSDKLSSSIIIGCRVLYKRIYIKPYCISEDTGSLYIFTEVYLALRSGDGGYIS